MKLRLFSFVLCSMLSINAMHQPTPYNSIQDITKLYQQARGLQDKKKFGIKPEYNNASNYIITMIKGKLQPIFPQYELTTSDHNKSESNSEAQLAKSSNETIQRLLASSSDWRKLMKREIPTKELFQYLLEYSSDVFTGKETKRHAAIIKKELSAADMTRAKKRKAPEQPRAPRTKKPIKQVSGQQKLDSFFGKK